MSRTAHPQSHSLDFTRERNVLAGEGKKGAGQIRPELNQRRGGPSFQRTSTLGDPSPRPALHRTLVDTQPHALCLAGPSYVDDDDATTTPAAYEYGQSMGSVWRTYTAPLQPAALSRSSAVGRRARKVKGIQRPTGPELLALGTGRPVRSVELAALRPRGASADYRGPTEGPRHGVVDPRLSPAEKATIQSVMEARHAGLTGANPEHGFRGI
ncbi:hypothetical protein Purlil1_3611 [Purpureocillium lilacinum]|uniref:Uncharacterized protein n=1 Tax=Purpureocillium lilacinum TaxID=33203 RepID=A0ABR0C654_PURLI|nr:hypothetical protein Purlil1_3611 [Purpureocillium lilacinum]